MKKLITFGCSFTNYGWPTWANIIAVDQPDWQFENWALGGGGNQMIARRVLYRHYAYGWQPDDMVCIQWSSWHREDRFKKNQWHQKGSVFVSEDYDIDWIEKYWDLDNDAINYMQAQTTTALLLGDNLVHQMQLADQ